MTVDSPPIPDAPGKSESTAEGCTHSEVSYRKTDGPRLRPNAARAENGAPE